MPLRSLAFLLVTAAIGGCAGDQPRVSAQMQAALPTEQLSLSSEFCPEESAAIDLPPDEVRRSKAKGRQQFLALEKAYRANPEALVRTKYFSSDEGDGEEDQTVRELARGHLLGATEEDITDAPCFRRAARRLRALLQE